MFKYFRKYRTYGTVHEKKLEMKWTGKKGLDTGCQEHMSKIIISKVLAPAAAAAAAAMVNDVHTAHALTGLN